MKLTLPNDITGSNPLKFFRFSSLKNAVSCVI